ncbi:MAG: TRM11 family SAM-dependent methyltransferase, partial [Candidatus Hodarchaeales archaeon]|jgi:tRNA G10  N-methylase Trm11
LCIELIAAFGKESKNIIDPFVGAGSSLIAASILNKKATGIDINAFWLEIYGKVCQENNIDIQDFLIGDAEHVAKTFNEEQFDFLLTDVPYFNMDKLPKTRGKFSRAGEDSKEKLPSSLQKFNNVEYESKDVWLAKLTKIFSNFVPVLKDNSYLVIFIGNMYRNIQISNKDKKKRGVYMNLSSELASSLREIGLNWRREIIWIDPGKKLGIYGYPYVWIPSILDQRILIFQK